MFAKVVICLVVCATLTSAAVLPLAAAGVVAPYATSYNAHTVNHNIAAPYVAAAAPLATARYVAAPVAAPVAARYVAAAPAAAPLAYAASPYAVSPYSYPYLF
ncbi:uncharacterized protein LOC120418185 [Culex pipiens pallens]|uniref:uncharacterized protein LOC120418185 n=1 Tax=Culex pipiens pallens TaxID=42434 RepID=UPI001954E9AA|nr:uncharacterized protein LOC120418185 [Culex pipiens pallens]